MKKTKVVPLRIPESLDALAAIKAEQQHTDKATALRQWLHDGAEQYVLRLLSEGRISVGRSAELLDVSIYDIHELVQARGLDIGPTDEQIARSRETGTKFAAALDAEQASRRKAAG